MYSYNKNRLKGFLDLLGIPGGFSRIFRETKNKKHEPKLLWVCSECALKLLSNYSEIGLEIARNLL